MRLKRLEKRDDGLRVLLDFKLREILLADIRRLGQFNVHHLRKFLHVCRSVEFCSTASYRRWLSVFVDILSAGASKLSRTGKDYPQSLLVFSLSRHGRIYIMGYGALSN